MLNIYWWIWVGLKNWEFIKSEGNSPKLKKGKSGGELQLSVKLIWSFYLTYIAKKFLFSKQMLVLRFSAKEFWIGNNFDFWMKTCDIICDMVWEGF